MGEDIASVIEAINKLIATLINAFGAPFTIFLIFAVPIVTYLWKRYNSSKKEKVYDKLIDEKDETIKRMKEEVKMYRIHFFKENGWTEEDVDKYIK